MQHRSGVRVHTKALAEVCSRVGQRVAMSPPTKGTPALQNNLMDREAGAREGVRTGAFGHEMGHGAANQARRSSTLRGGLGRVGEHTGRPGAQRWVCTQQCGPRLHP